VPFGGLLGEGDYGYKREKNENSEVQIILYIELSAMMVSTMNWNDAAEDLLNQVLAQTPYPVRDATEEKLRGVAEGIAEDEGKQRVGVETVIIAWVQSTPEALRPDLPRLMEKFGLDPDEYRHLLG
jgi:hypothetical protein